MLTRLCLGGARRVKGPIRVAVEYDREAGASVESAGDMGEAYRRVPLGMEESMLEVVGGEENVVPVMEGVCLERSAAVSTSLKQPGISCTLAL